MKSHNLEKKSAKRRRSFRRENAVDEGNTGAVKKQLNL